MLSKFLARSGFLNLPIKRAFIPSVLSKLEHKMIETPSLKFLCSFLNFLKIPLRALFYKMIQLNQNYRYFLFLIYNKIHHIIYKLFMVICFLFESLLRRFRYLWPLLFLDFNCHQVEPRTGSIFCSFTICFALTDKIESFRMAPLTSIFSIQSFNFLYIPSKVNFLRCAKDGRIENCSRIFVRF